jgi:Arc-like DNA binding domain
MTPKRSNVAEMQVRLPPDVKGWLEQEAERNWTSQNSEIIRAVRTVMMGAERPTKVAG